MITKPAPCRCPDYTFPHRMGGGACKHIPVRLLYVADGETLTAAVARWMARGTARRQHRAEPVSGKES